MLQLLQIRNADSVLNDNTRGRNLIMAAEWAGRIWFPAMIRAEVETVRLGSVP
jgi:hypothetical protein